MNLPANRRDFLKQTGTALATLGAPSLLRGAGSPGDKIIVGVMGCNGRGMAHIASYLAQKNTEVAYVCDVDSRAIEKGLKAVQAKQDRKARGVTDFRRVLEDPDVNVLTIATPNHWHAPAAILACAAGKHVYVEKPGSHDPHESALIVQAARTHRRTVQMGNQRRSWPWVQEAIQAVQTGEIGRVFFARTWYNNRRPSIGHGKLAPVPDWLNYDLWQGPAPRRPYKDNLIHYNWHWHWHWGNGEIGNNGIHALDLARWGLQVDCPKRVTCGGHRYHYQDDQETPDTTIATFDFGDKGATWEGHSCDPHGFEGTGFGVTFYGESGCLIIAGNNARIIDLKNKPVREIKGEWNDAEHFANFLTCIRSGQKPNSDIEDGQKSTLLCHLGNIAYRSGQTLDLDPGKRQLLNNPKAAAFWKHQYEPGWEPTI